jgi:hypothetical protein
MWPTLEEQRGAARRKQLLEGLQVGGGGGRPLGRVREGERGRVETKLVAPVLCTLNMCMSVLIMCFSLLPVWEFSCIDEKGKGFDPGVFGCFDLATLAQPILIVLFAIGYNFKCSVMDKAWRTMV